MVKNDEDLQDGNGDVAVDTGGQQAGETKK